jgi:alkylation response protein AidB-like acyl-CoA dehydrogenase
MLARRAVKGEPPIIRAAKALQDELLGPPSPPPSDDSPLADERRAVEAYKKATLMVFGIALETYGQKLSDQQEVLMHLSDMLMEVYAADSALLRAQAATDGRAARASLHAAAARVLVNDAAFRLEASARQALAAMAEGDGLRTYLAGLRRLFKTTPINTVALRRTLADEAVAGRGYPFQLG